MTKRPDPAQEQNAADEDTAARTAAPVPVIPGEVFDGVSSGVPLAQVLASIDPGDVADLGLVDGVLAARRLGAWAYAQQARWAAELTRRSAMFPWSEHDGLSPDDTCVAGAVLATALCESTVATWALVREGVAFATTMARTGAALEAGVIDARRAKTMVAKLQNVPTVLVHQIEDQLLPTAAERTVSELGRDIERALDEADPDGAVHRHEDAHAGRRVSHPRRLPNSMASISCTLSAVDAARIDTVLESAARTARALGDVRTLDQLRADGLCDLVNGNPQTTGHLHPLDLSTPTHVGAVRAARQDEPQTAHDTVLHGETSRPGPPQDEITHATTPVTGSHDQPPDPPSPAGPAGPGEDGSRCCGSCASVRSHAVVHIRMDLTTAMGKDDNPAYLAGHGPIDAAQARDIALDPTSIWQRIITDPLSGAVLDLGRTRYRPTKELAEFIRARDQRCARPGCDIAAERCDLDHTIEYHGVPNGPPAPPGTTSADNLAPLCRADHRLKTEGGHILRQPTPGTLIWEDPLGRRTLSRPGLDLPLERLPHNPHKVLRHTGTRRRINPDAPPAHVPPPEASPKAGDSPSTKTSAHAYRLIERARQRPEPPTAPPF